MRIDDDSVRVSLSPDTTIGAPDSLVQVYVTLDSAGPEINGYETVIRWDPDLLDFVSVQPESLFAQYNQWWHRDIGPDSVFISHVIMQGGITVTGPGRLSSLTLRARHPGETTVRFRYIDFYRSGFLIPSTVTHEAFVRIIDPSSDVAEPAWPRSAGLGLSVQPNPITPESVVLAELPDGTPGDLHAFDALGRVLGESASRSLHLEPVGGQTVSLRSLLDPGRHPAGVYWLVLSTRRGTTTCRLVSLGAGGGY